MIQAKLIRDDYVPTDSEGKGCQSTWEERVNKFLRENEKIIVDCKTSFDSHGIPILLALYDVDSGLAAGPKVRKPSETKKPPSDRGDTIS